MEGIYKNEKFEIPRSVKYWNLNLLSNKKLQHAIDKLLQIIEAECEEEAKSIKTKSEVTYINGKQLHIKDWYLLKKDMS